MDTSKVKREEVSATPVTFLTRYWVAVLGGVIVLWLAVSAFCNRDYLHTNAGPCFGYSLALSSDFESCKTSLNNAIKSVPIDTSKNKPFFKWSIPGFLMWMDNMFVDVYTLFFIASAGLAYKKLTGVRSDPIVLWRTAITITCILALLGALADHSENFWILAYMQPRGEVLQDPSAGEVQRVARLSVLKFQFFMINLGLNAIWWGAVALLDGWEKKQYVRLNALLAASEAERLGQLLGLPAKHSDVRWPDELFPHLKNANLATRSWLGTFFLHFVTGHEADAMFRWSFSIHAIQRWKSKLKIEPTDSDSKKKYDAELDRFLKALCNEGYLTPKGVRYEVTCSSFHPSGPTSKSGPPGDVSPNESRTDAGEDEPTLQGTRATGR